MTDHADQRQVSVWLPAEVYEQLRRSSFELRRTRTDIITEALTGYLSASSEPAGASS